MMQTWQQAEEEGHAAGWLVPPKEVERRGIIGKGSFGTTYIGSFRGAEVAVKAVEVRDEFESNSFLRELGALTRARHPNIVAFQGAVLQHPQACWLIVEYLPGGSLKDWLYGTDGRTAPKRHMKEKLNMALGAAKGMAALHALNPPIMHRDLKPSNVMLDAQMQPKVSDFGLAREDLANTRNSLTAETGTYVYMSPEMVQGKPYGLETDVFSFGIMLAEIVKQKSPYSDQHLTPMQVATGVAGSDIRPHVHSLFHRIPKGLSELMESCWAANPSSRPNFDTVVQSLEAISMHV